VAFAASCIGDGGLSEIGVFGRLVVGWGVVSMCRNGCVLCARRYGAVPRVDRLNCVDVRRVIIRCACLLLLHTCGPRVVVWPERDARNIRFCVGMR